MQLAPSRLCPAVSGSWRPLDPQLPLPSSRRLLGSAWVPPAYARAWKPPLGSKLGQLEAQLFVFLSQESPVHCPPHCLKTVVSLMVLSGWRQGRTSGPCSCVCRKPLSSWPSPSALCVLNMDLGAGMQT